MKINSFKELGVWKESFDLAVLVYKVTLTSGFNKDFGLRDQLRRSTVSIPSNIAEGFGRQNNNELIHFLHISKGSCAEAITQLIISYRIGYIKEKDYSKILDQFTFLDEKISRFINYLKTKKLNKEFLNK